MRILQVHTRYRQRGGEDSVVSREAALLSSNGHTVELYEFHNPNDMMGAVRGLAVAPWNSKAAGAVVEAARTFQADVVHVHNTWFALSPAVFPALSAAGFPTVLTVHNYRMACVKAILFRDGRICEDCVGKLPWRGVVHRCYRNSAAQSAAVAVTIGTHRALGTWTKHVDVFISLTGFAVRYLVSSGVPEDTIVVKPNVVDDPGSRATSPSRGDAVLFVGRLSEEKGVEDLVAAWQSARLGGLRLRLIGDGPLAPWLTEAGRADASIEVVGPLDGDAVKAEMKAARALVLPSRIYEGMPMVLLEAMAAGLPVVVPEHGALPEIAGDGGLVFRSGSVPDLIRALGELVSSEAVDERGNHSREEYAKRYSPPVAIAALEAVYELARSRRDAR